jgi:hypothetical protein
LVAEHEGDARPDSDLDLAFELQPSDGEELAELIEHRRQWKAELAAITGLVVKDIYLRSDPEVSGRIVRVFSR